MYISYFTPSSDRLPVLGYIHIPRPPLPNIYLQLQLQDICRSWVPKVRSQSGNLNCSCKDGGPGYKVVPWLAVRKTILILPRPATSRIATVQLLPVPSTLHGSLLSTIYELNLSVSRQFADPPPSRTLRYTRFTGRCLARD